MRKIYRDDEKYPDIFLLEIKRCLLKRYPSDKIILIYFPLSESHPSKPFIINRKIISINVYNNLKFLNSFFLLNNLFS